MVLTGINMNRIERQKKFRGQGVKRRVRTKLCLICATMVNNDLIKQLEAPWDINFAFALMQMPK